MEFKEAHLAVIQMPSTASFLEPICLLEGTTRMRCAITSVLFLLSRGENLFHLADSEPPGIPPENT